MMRRTHTPQAVKIYRVGGSVRDELLGRAVADRDWVVIGATPEILVASGYKPVGRDFPVFLHRDTGEEYALARTERKHGRGYHGFEFFASPDVTLAEDLASHGYIVVGIDAPYRTRVFVTPDGRVIERSDENNPETVAPEQALEHMLPRLVAEWVADIAFTLDQLEQLNISDPADRLTGKLDLTRVGVVGHSLGGAIAAQFCLNDARCKVGIDIDGLVMENATRSPSKAPFMFLMSDHSGDDKSDPSDRQIAFALDAAYQHLPSQTRAWLEIRGANHYNFSDGAVIKSHIVMSLLRMIGIVGIDSRRQLAITAYCIQTFLGKFLAQEPSVFPTAPESLYPEVERRP